MPAAYMCFPVGVALLIGGALAYLLYGDYLRELFALGTGVFILPGALTIYRFFRGHFNSQLNEP